MNGSRILTMGALVIGGWLLPAAVCRGSGIEERVDFVEYLITKDVVFLGRLAPDDSSNSRRGGWKTVEVSEVLLGTIPSRRFRLPLSMIVGEKVGDKPILVWAVANRDGFAGDIAIIGNMAIIRPDGGLRMPEYSDSVMYRDRSPSEPGTLQGIKADLAARRSENGLGSLDGARGIALMRIGERVPLRPIFRVELMGAAMGDVANAPRFVRFPNRLRCHYAVGRETLLVPLPNTPTDTLDLRMCLDQLKLTDGIASAIRKPLTELSQVLRYQGRTVRTVAIQSD